MEYIKKTLMFYKKLEEVTKTDGETPFNSTELQLLRELAFAKMENRRLISTQIAKLLGVTRSSVSQMVNKLEIQGVVKRVPDEIDRKIAYIEMTEESEQLCGAELEKWTTGMTRITKAFGKEKMEKMIALLEEFVSIAEKMQ